MADTSGETAYTYDDLYRLTDVTYPNSDVQTYDYDPMGNRTEKTHNSLPTAYSYDDADQMTLAGGVSYDYDDKATRLELPFRTITLTPEVSIAVHHLYLVTYDPSGSTRAYRAGSSKPWNLGGQFDVDRGPWDDSFTDFDADNSDDAVNVLNNYEACTRWTRAFDRVSNEVDGILTYGVLTRNSNSFVRAFLEAAGAPVKVTHPGGWTPGWGNSLGY